MHVTVYGIPEKPAAIIFDIDSTLYTNEEYIQNQIDSQIRRFAETRGLEGLKARNMIFSYRDEWAKLNGGKRPSLGNVLKDLGVPISETVEWRKELIHPERFLSADKKLAETLAVLAASYKLLCITNNPVSVGRKTLEVLGADPFISGIIGLDTCGLSKPDPKIFELAAKRADASVDRCISVGDRYDIDLAVPVETGMGAILVNGVHDVYELPAILKK